MDSSGKARSRGRDPKDGHSDKGQTWKPQVFPRGREMSWGQHRDEGKSPKPKVREGRSPRRVLGRGSWLLSDFSWRRHLVALFRVHRLIPSLALLWFWETVS